MHRRANKRVPLALLALIFSLDFSESDADARLPKPVRPQLTLEEKDAADGPLHLLAEEDFVWRAAIEGRVWPARIVENLEVATRRLEVPTREQHRRVPTQHFLEGAEEPLDAAIRPGVRRPTAEVPHLMAVKKLAKARKSR